MKGNMTESNGLVTGNHAKSDITDSPKKVHCPPSLVADLSSRCLPHIHLRLYSNPALVQLYPPSLLVTVLSSFSQGEATWPQLRERSLFLHDLFQFEFPSVSVELDRASGFLLSRQILELQENTYRVVPGHTVNLLRRILFPFLLQYQMFFNAISKVSDLISCVLG